MTDSTLDRRPSPLPRGPHRLTREEVERSQRERLLTGAAEAVAEKGYAKLSVGDILERAGVSRTTFYQLYRDKLDCFLAAYRMAADVVAAVMVDELARLEGDHSTTTIERLDRLLGAYLQTLADNPALARVFLVEVYAAGRPAIEQRRESQQQFVDLVIATTATTNGDRGRRGLGGGTNPRFAAEVLVGGIGSMVTTLIGVDETHRLPELREPLIDLAADLLGSGAS